MPPRMRWLVRLILFVLATGAAYGAVRSRRTELVDFVVPRQAAARFLAHEPLYRPEDGHYQYKYLPAFALVMAPFAWAPKELAQAIWFTLTVLMAWALVRLSFAALPDPHLARGLLVALTLLLTGKFLVKELAFGQFNLPVALLLLAAVVAAQQGKAGAAGAAVAAGILIKPYALVFTPWLAWTLGWRPFVSFALVLGAGLLLPALSYGWDGNVTLLQEWYRTVVDTTGPNLLSVDNISFASMWAKWLGPGPNAAGLALASVIAAIAAGAVIMARRRGVAEPNYLEGAYFALLVPLISPQGWDYVLIIGLPAFMCLVDRWPSLPTVWRAVVLASFFLTSFTIYDLLRRTLYLWLVESAAVSVGAVLVAACLLRLRWRALA